MHATADNERNNQIYARVLHHSRPHICSQLHRSTDLSRTSCGAYRNARYMVRQHGASDDGEDDRTSDIPAGVAVQHCRPQLPSAGTVTVKSLRNEWPEFAQGTPSLSRVDVRRSRARTRGRVAPPRARLPAAWYYPGTDPWIPSFPLGNHRIPESCLEYSTVHSNSTENLQYKLTFQELTGL